MDVVYEKLDEAALKVIEKEYKITIGSASFTRPSPIKERYSQNFWAHCVKSNHPKAKFPFEPISYFQNGKYPGMHELGKFLPQYPDPVLLEDFGPYNIVGWGNEYYGIPKQLGKIDITSDNLSELENIFVYLSLEGLKKTIQKYLNNLDIFQQTQTQLQQTQTQLQQTQTQLQQTQTQLQQTQAQLQQTQAQLQQTQAQLQQTQTQLQQTQARIEAMESSKFWKLRRAWFKVKKRLGLPTGES